MKLLLSIVLFVFLAVVTVSAQVEVSRGSMMISFPNETSSTFYAFPLSSKKVPLRQYFLRLVARSIREVDRRQTTSIQPKTIVRYNLEDYPFELVRGNITLGEHIAPSVIFTTKLPNNATFSGSVVFPEESFSFEYGHLNISLDPTSIKFSFEVENWPFQNTSNWLQVGVSFDSYTYNVYNDLREDEEYRYNNITTPDTAVYMRFVKYALLDDGIENDIEPNIEPTDFTLFWYQTRSFKKRFYYDPDFSILLKSDPVCTKLNDCNGNGDCIQDNKCDCYDGYQGNDCIECVDQVKCSLSQEQRAADSTNKKNGGLKTYAKVAIGCVVSAVGVVALVIMVRFYVIKRNRARMIAKIRKTTNQIETGHSANENHN